MKPPQRLIPFGPGVIGRSRWGRRAPVAALALAACLAASDLVRAADPLPQQPPQPTAKADESSLPPVGDVGPTLNEIPAHGRASSREPAPQLAAEVERLVAQLDSDHFENRQSAAEQLEALCRTTTPLEPLAVLLNQALVQSDVSFEVRAQLAPLVERLPQVELPDPPQEVDEPTIDALVASLGADDYGLRIAAARRLAWLTRAAGPMCAILGRLKARLADAEISPDTRAHVQSAYDSTRRQWLLADPAEWHLPPVSLAQIEGWIAQLIAPETPSVARDAAQRELLEALCRDELLEATAGALRARLEAGGLDEAAAARLAQLVDWTRPAMVAEFWQGRDHQGVQHLLVDVPSRPETATRASHFDRIDDQVAHCVSGNSLSPGDYPVGVAFPHPTAPPQGGHAYFHLVNLPTPRRRMAYECSLSLDQTVRHRALSERTFARWLALKQPLTDREVLIVDELDGGVFSRFAGPYFLAIDDDPYPPEQIPAGQGSASRHGTLALELAVCGTREALPGLVEAIGRGRFAPPDPRAPYQLAWIAALTIAARDPWPGIDRWLAALAPRSESLLVDRGEAPQLGATAAAMLVDRHGLSPSSFGLEQVEDRLLTLVGCPSFRPRQAGDVERVLRWWREHESPAAERQPSQPEVP